MPPTSTSPHLIAFWLSCSFSGLFIGCVASRLIVVSVAFLSNGQWPPSPPSPPMPPTSTRPPSCGQRRPACPQSSSRPCRTIWRRLSPPSAPTASSLTRSVPPIRLRFVCKGPKREHTQRAGPAGGGGRKGGQDNLAKAVPTIGTYGQLSNKVSFLFCLWLELHSGEGRCPIILPPLTELTRFEVSNALRATP